jgi:hypothetical protein
VHRTPQRAPLTRRRRVRKRPDREYKAGDRHRVPSWDFWVSSRARDLEHQAIGIDGAVLAIAVRYDRRKCAHNPAVKCPRSALATRPRPPDPSDKLTDESLCPEPTGVIALAINANVGVGELFRECSALQ